MSSDRKLSSHDFNSLVWYLTLESQGNILTSRGNGWYEFSECMMRGYVRLLAQAEGLKFKLDILERFGGPIEFLFAFSQSHHPGPAER